MKLIMQVQMEVEAGNIKPVNPIHLAINIISMSVFPFIGRPIIQGLLHIDDEAYFQFMNARKKAITEFVIHALRKE